MLPPKRSREDSPTTIRSGQILVRAPEVGPLGSDDVAFEPIVLDSSADRGEYAPVAGLHELRSAVANLYNELFSAREAITKYTAENVAISGGGRVGLTRIAATLRGYPYRTHDSPTIRHMRSFSQRFADVRPSHFSSTNGTGMP